MIDIYDQVITFQKDRNLNLRNDFISQFQPLITRAISNVTNRYVSTYDSDEYAIGLEAFNEAIDKYVESKGSFPSYAQLVIRSRVTDYMRREMNYNGKIVLGEEILLNQAMDVDEHLVAEIQSLKSRLTYFGINLLDLVEEAPVHTKVKNETIILSKKISEDELLSKKLYKTKKLPMAEIILKYSVTKKRLKTYRNYIITVITIFKEKLTIIETYLTIRGDQNE